MSYETLDYKINRLTPSHRLNLPLKKCGMDRKYPMPCVSSDSIFLINVGTSIVRFGRENFISPIATNANVAPIKGVNHTCHGVFVEDDDGASYLLDLETLQVNRELPSGVSFSKNSATYQDTFFLYRKKGEGILAPEVLTAMNTKKWEFAWEFASNGVIAGYAAGSGKLVQSDYEGTLYCLDIVSGNLIWKHSIETLGILSPEQLARYKGLLLSGYPRIYKETVTYALSNYLIGLDLNTGELKWKHIFEREVTYTTVTEAGLLHFCSPAKYSQKAEMYTITCETGNTVRKVDVGIPEFLKHKFDYVKYTDVTDTHLWCLSPRGLLSAVNLVSGIVDWHHDIDDQVTDNPLFISQNKLYVSTLSKLSVFEGSKI